MKIEYELFAHHYILSGDKDKAYKAAYPHASGEPLKIAARKLLNRPEVRQFIDRELAAAREKALVQYHAREQEMLEEERAGMLLVRKQLRRIISGETKQKKYFKFKDRIECVETDMPPFAILRAIEINLKIDNEWYKRYGKAFAAPIPPRPGEPTGQNKSAGTDLSIEEWIDIMDGEDFHAGLRAQIVKDNPRKAEEYRQKGLPVLDHVPDIKELDQMKIRHREKMEEWRELKKFADEQEDHYETILNDIEQYKQEEDDPLPDPPSAPDVYQHTKNNATPPISISNDTKQHQTAPAQHDSCTADSPANTQNETHYIYKPKGGPVSGEEQALIQQGAAPRSVPPPTKLLTSEEILLKFNEAYQAALKDPESILYVKPENNDTPPQNDTN